MASVVQFRASASSGTSRDTDRRSGPATSPPKPPDPDLPRSATLRVDNEAEKARSLATFIEGDIIPRLMLAHAGALPASGPVTPGRILGKAAIDPDEIEELAPLAMQVEADTLLDYIEAILARGTDFETVLVQLLAPTARLLGKYWEDDRCDFVDVTMALWRLEEVVHEISGRLPAERPHFAGGHCALFASIPGDQHSFGAVIIEDIFRRAGWLTDLLVRAETPELLKRGKNEWFDIIGLTVSCDCHIAELPSIIAALRSVSKNPQVAVIVGGRVFSEDPGLAARVSADGTAADADAALRIAEDLVCEREWTASRRCCAT
jgi:methanogenic corrinoid protein MtbC1